MSMPRSFFACFHKSIDSVQFRTKGPRLGFQNKRYPDHFSGRLDIPASSEVDLERETDRWSKLVESSSSVKYSSLKKWCFWKERKRKEKSFQSISLPIYPSILFPTLFILPILFFFLFEWTNELDWRWKYKPSRSRIRNSDVTYKKSNHLNSTLPSLPPSPSLLYCSFIRP